MWLTLYKQIDIFFQFSSHPMSWLFTRHFWGKLFVIDNSRPLTVKEPWMTASQILGNFCWQNCHLFQVLAGQWFPDKHISRTLSSSRDLLLNWVACDQKMLPFLGFRASFRVSQKSSFSLWERWVFQFGLENVSRKHYYWLLWWAEQLPLLPNSTHRHYREPCVCVL